MAMIDKLVQVILRHSAEQAGPNVVNLELLEAAWPTLVGQEMARRTRPRRWHEGTLHIDVSSHAWVQELSFHRERLLGRIQQIFPWPLERLHLSVAPHFEPLERRDGLEELVAPARPHRRRPQRPLGDEQEREVDDVLGGMDAETRARMLRIRRHIKGADDGA